MQNWRKLWISLGLILILLYAVPKKIELKDSVILQGTQEDIFAYMVNLESWDKWFPQVGSDYKFKGIPGVVGSSLSWISPDFGTTTITLVELEEPNFITLSMNIGDKAQPEESKHFFKLDRVPDGIRLDWSVHSHKMTLWRYLYLKFTEEKLKKNFKPNFKNLKETLKNP